MNMKCLFAASAFTLTSVFTAQGASLRTIKEVMRGIIPAVYFTDTRSNGQSDTSSSSVVRARYFRVRYSLWLQSRPSLESYRQYLSSQSTHSLPHQKKQAQNGKKSAHKPRKRPNWPGLGRGPMSF